MNYKIAVVGADLFAGQELMRILEERNFPFAEIVVIKNYDQSMHFSFAKKENEHKINITRLEDCDFADVDFCFLMSNMHIPQIQSKCIIDCSSKFTLDENSHFLIPEVNMENFQPDNNLIVNPAPITIQIAVITQQLLQISQIKRIVFASYQAVASTGDGGMHELFEQTRSIFMNGEIKSEVFDKKISFNCIPKIGDFCSNGSTTNELRVAQELQKLFKNKELKITGTMVQVPVFRGDAIALNIEFENDFDLEDVVTMFEDNDGILIIDRKFEDELMQENFATNVDAEKEDCIYISRIRKDDSVEFGINLWIATDAVRKGNALNAVQIAEKILQNNDYNN